MKCIDNPTKAASFPSVGMAPVVALATEGGKETIVAKKPAISSRLVVNILAFILSAAFAYGMEDKIRLFCLGILFVFALALGGCIPQPSAALEALRSFEWSF